ncbi:MAG: Lrp/AsnC ligand binding domain-containing protein [Halobacteriovoraceae bacterium]|nr:Lrp/AsnC ligand binding domain-containing protein [Halobacteriovoraceae bacterium]MCB9095397.1 Lrp/AsnC ligand binding domain-containing protein [Halobacteriovoraceae bacterium]
MAEKYQIDKLDRQILKALQENARVSFLDLSKKLLVAGGTIHQRVQKMTEAGIIKGSQFVLDYQNLGYDITAFIGLFLKSARDQNKVVSELKKIPQVIEVYYTTGTFALLIKVVCKNMKDFHMLLAEKIQSIDEIQSTESFLCLDSPVQRSLDSMKV